MQSQIDLFIQKLGQKEKIITYLKNLYRIEIGEEALIPQAYYNDDFTEEPTNPDTTQSPNSFNSFEDKVKSLKLPTLNDRNIKLKIQKLKKAKDRRFLIYHLDLSGYKHKTITLPLLKTVVEGLKIYKSCEDVNLTHNNLDDSYADLVCELLSLEGMRRINISHNNFGKPSSRKFATAMRGNKKLEYIDLSYNPFNTCDYTCLTLCNEAKTIPNLFHFGLNDSSRDAAVRMLANKNEIKSLNLDDSRYKPKTFEHFSKLLCDKKTQIAFLSFKYTNIDLFVACHFEKVLRLNKSLVYLNLYSSGISDIGGSRIIQGLEYNKTLIELHLGENKLSHRSCKTLGRILKVNGILNTIDINKNYEITDEDFANLLDGLVNNQNVVSLGDLAEMKIGIRIRESAQSILELNKKYLNSLDVMGNTNIGINKSVELSQSQKMNYFKSSVDWEVLEKAKRESLDFEQGCEGDEDFFEKYEIGKEDEDCDNFNFFIYGD